MITFIAHIRVKPENANAFEACMTDICTRVRENEPGAVLYNFAKSVKDPDTYVVIEVFRDEDAHRVHNAMAYVKESIPKTAVLIDGKPDLKRYVSP